MIWTADCGLRPDGLPRATRELYDSDIKVPMIIRWPEAFSPTGVMPGAVDERRIVLSIRGPRFYNSPEYPCLLPCRAGILLRRM